MKALATAFREVWGLFVEDASFTMGIVVVVALAILVLPHLGVAASWRGPLIFLALAVVLLENIFRSARVHRGR